MHFNFKHFGPFSGGSARYLVLVSVQAAYFLVISCLMSAKSSQTLSKGHKKLSVHVHFRAYMEVARWGRTHVTRPSTERMSRKATLPHVLSLTWSLPKISWMLWLQIIWDCTTTIMIHGATNGLGNMYVDNTALAEIRRNTCSLSRPARAQGSVLLSSNFEYCQQLFLWKQILTVDH